MQPKIAERTSPFVVRPIDDDRDVVGWDTETHRIGPNKIHPPIVSVQVSCGDDLQVACVADGDAITDLVGLILSDQDFIRIAHNSAFDLGVLFANYPQHITMIFEQLLAGRLLCTKVREKLINLTTHGNLEYLTVGDSSKKINYSLSDLVMQYFGVDLKEQKTKIGDNGEITGNEDGWRINFDMLEDMPSKDWPQEAWQYAVDDAVWAERIFHRQEEIRKDVYASTGIDPFKVEAFRCGVDFVLGLLTARGVATDADRVEDIEAMLSEELSADKMTLLLAHDIITPAAPPRPYANGARDHRPDCPSGGKGKTCDCPPKMTTGDREKLNRGNLINYVVQLAENNPDEFELWYTDPTDNNPEGSVSIVSGWLEEYAAKDEVLTEYKHRQDLQKLVTTEIPRMKWGDPKVTAPIVHANFDFLKATGRTSSFAGNLYPSFNGQNVDPRVRQCYVPRAGHLFFSVDYTAMELGTFAQTCIDLFGYSKLADIINAGIDPHAYLGAQLALHLDPDFQECLCEIGVDLSDKDAVYEAFHSLKDDDAGKDYYKHWRKFAKPTGLGYPGGLGAETFVAYAKATYGIEVSLEDATKMKEIWKSTFPEAKEFFDYVNQLCTDDFNGPKTKRVKKRDTETGELIYEERVQDRYKYRSPLGMWRMACDYCACCNGMGLQTPSAEGALLGLFDVVRAIHDPSLGSDLYGNLWVLLFIHDENFGEIKQDTPKRMTQLLDEVVERMVRSMRIITPDVRAGAEAVLMTRWDKFAESNRDQDGYLIPHDPD